MRVDEQESDEARRPDEQALHCKVHTHQGPRRRSGDCAWKAAGITPGDLTCCRDSTTEGAERRTERRQKSAEGVVVAQAMKARTNWSGK